MSLAPVQEEIARRLETLGLKHVFRRRVTESTKPISAPCAVVGLPQVDYDLTYGRTAGRHSMTWPVVLYVSQASDLAGMTLALEYLAPSGERSVAAAVSGTGDNATFYRVTDGRVEQDMVVGLQTYTALIFTVESTTR